MRSIDRLSGLDRWAGLVGTFIAGASLGLVALADFGWFAVWTAVAVTALAAGGAAAIWRPAIPLRWPRPSRDGWLALLILLVGAALIAPGSESVAGPRDQATYLATGVAIGRWGNATVSDPGLQLLGSAMDPAQINAWLYESALNGARIRFPTQLFIRDLQSGTVEGAFLPVLPVWIALASGLAGLEPGLHVAGVFGILALAFVMLATSAAADRSSPATPFWPLVGAALAISFSQVWWAREPMAETALGAFSWIAAWAAVRWRGCGSWRFGILAALSAATALFTRADGVLLAIAVGLLTAGSDLPGRWAARLVLAAGLAMTAIHWATVATVYMSATYGAFTFGRAAGGLGVVTAVGVVLAAAAILRRRPGLAGFRSVLERSLVWGRRYGVLVLVGVGAVVVAIGVAPGTGREPTQGAASPLAWLPGYIPWPLLILAAIGFVALGWTGAPRPMVPLLLIGGLPALLYLPDPLVTGDHPWMVRRLVPVVIPLIAIAASIGAAALWRLPTSGMYPQIRGAVRVAAAVLVGLGLSLEVGHDQDLVGPRHGSGAIDGLHRLRAELPPSAVVIFPSGTAGVHLALPLDWVMGVRAFAVPGPTLTPAMADTLARLEADGHPIYWATEGARPFVGPAGVAAAEPRVTRVSYTTTEHGRVPPPLQLTAVEDVVTLYRLTFERRSPPISKG